MSPTEDKITKFACYCYFFNFQIWKIPKKTQILEHITNNNYYCNFQFHLMIPTFYMGSFRLVLFGDFLCVLQDRQNRRVGFVGAALKTTSSFEDSSRPSRLHRRDTPHHLKNKRITTTTVDKEKVAAIIAQVSKSFFPIFQI